MFSICGPNFACGAWSKYDDDPNSDTYQEYFCDYGHVLRYKETRQELVRQELREVTR